MKLSSIKDVEKIKDSIGERYKAELAAKNQEVVRLEKIYTDRIDSLNREQNKLTVQLDHQVSIERELREKLEAQRKERDELKVAVEQSKDGERKELIKIQIELNSLKQERTIKDEFHSKQIYELKEQVQQEVLERERSQLALTTAEERAQHESQLVKERFQLEREKLKNQYQRQLQSLEDKAKDDAEELKSLECKLEKLENQLQDSRHQSKKDLEEAQEKYDNACSKYDKQIRELRAQINLRAKDLSHAREETQDLESRLLAKQGEIKQLRAQIQVLQGRYEES